MAEPLRKPANKRFEAMRSQIKNTLFEATTELTSPKSMNEALTFQLDKLPQVMRKLPQKTEQPEQNNANPCFEQGKWRKMTEITQKRNFEMMRAGLKVQMFGKTEAAPSNVLVKADNDNESVKPKVHAELDISEAKTNDSLQELAKNSKEDNSNEMNETIVLHSLLPSKNTANETKKIVDHEGNEIEEVSTLNRQIFKKFDRSQRSEVDEQASEEDAHIFYIENNFHQFYYEREILGEGTSGIVKKCVKVSTEEEFAVKITNFRGDDEIKTLVLKEFKNHRRLQHKNVVRVYELYIDTFKNKIYTVMELVRCREMFDVIQELGSFCEADASMIFKQILLAIQYLHSSGVCHRDLKPNNILASNDGKIVKVTDFNVSKFIDKSKKQYTGLSKENYKMWTYTGTIAFTAPEVLADTEYTEMVDMWSAGCVLYTMLCGYQPFQAEYLKDLIDKIIEGVVEFKPEHWDKISPEAKDLIQRLLEKDPKKRLAPYQALLHPWICNLGKVPRDNITDLADILKDNARKNSKAACLASRNVQTALLPNLKKKKSSPIKTSQTLEDNQGQFSDVFLKDLQSHKLLSESKF